MKKFNWIIGILSLCFIVSAFQKADRQDSLDCNYMRFHVVANSDSPEDQQLKLKVRDRLLEEFKDTFKDVESVEDAEEKVRAELQRLEEIANDEIERQGKDYRAKAMVGFFDFPIKAYGDLVLPAGKYHALKIVIGEGGGANWWCVMFPPLCFVDISHGVAVDTTDEPADRQVNKPIDKPADRQMDKLDDKPVERKSEDEVNPASDDVEERETSVEKKEIQDDVIEYRLKSKDWFNRSVPKMSKLFSLIPGI